MKKLALVLFSTALIISCESKKQKASASEDVDSTLITHTIDHVILAINNLDSGMAQFERMTGVKPVFGGEHPGRGSHNALVSFGENTYLEIIAPRMNLDSVEAGHVAYLQDFDSLTPMGWAVTSSDTVGTKNILVEQGFAVSGFSSGGREKPNGDKLAWTTFGIAEDVPGLPFFIHWHMGTPHPATTSPSGAKLSQVYIQTPEAERLQKMVTSLDLPVTISNANVPAMKLVIEADGKQVEF